MGLFSKRVKLTYKVDGVIDRISDMGSDHTYFWIRLEGSRKIYRIFWNQDSLSGHSIFLAKPGDRITLTIEDGEQGKIDPKAVHFFNHDY